MPAGKIPFIPPPSIDSILKVSPSGHGRAPFVSAGSCPICGACFLYRGLSSEGVHALLAKAVGNCYTATDAIIPHQVLICNIAIQMPFVAPRRT